MKKESLLEWMMVLLLRLSRCLSPELFRATHFLQQPPQVLGAFSKLDAVKQTLDLEEYSLSQVTLEQVFLELSKEQEQGNFDDDVDATVGWKLL
ncbi:hypothetical protein G4228_019027 [Cervus hanglu yarkandensis]|nr:hypothetical protein G4228_019027 [Cervus hanglu yarkandensis]